METNNQNELIEKIKAQVEELWNTIQEAKKDNLNVQVVFHNFYIKPEISISKELFTQNGNDYQSLDGLITD
jgi:hypothetical protein